MIGDGVDADRCGGRSGGKGTLRWGRLGRGQAVEVVGADLVVGDGGKQPASSGLERSTFVRQQGFVDGGFVMGQDGTGRFGPLAGLDRRDDVIDVVEQCLYRSVGDVVPGQGHGERRVVGGVEGQPLHEARNYRPETR